MYLIMFQKFSIKKALGKLENTDSVKIHDQQARQNHEYNNFSDTWTTDSGNIIEAMVNSLFCTEKSFRLGFKRATSWIAMLII